MKRFLTTTAIVLAMTGTAHAQSDTGSFGQVTYQEGDFYASDLIGMRIYNSETQMDADATIADGGEQEWDDIGEINDIIVTKDGQVSAVILGVGGFLGMGERDVSVSMDDITVVREEGDSDDRFLVVSTSKEALEAAPAYERADADMDADVANDDVANDDAAATDDAAVVKDEAAADGTMAAQEGQRQMLTRPAVEREGYAEADMEMVSQMTSEDLEGTTVYGANDESVGEIESLIVGDDGKVSEIVINVGGFLGLGEKPVAVTFDELQILREEGGDDYRIYIDSTEQALEAQPEFEG
ncbi:photosystem reaction center subunit H [Pelagivirga sediminicola]|uniref:Photosystem reaction center subunit H n=1 Tax=Pelagivirga sediminicola TaxID=2170575 RepID=A0A2T7GA94_9RHOB|nr:PRC-barrel domain-containing protein [Pelagivirga sediminicola]PVA11329.1 photosystem reaction center subunit H [Pelagivirga sediminicola]